MAGITSDPPLATRHLFVPWEESNAQAWEVGAQDHSATRFGQFDGLAEKEFAMALVGWTTLLADGTFSRQVPEYHPKFPWMYARRVRYNRETGEPSNIGPERSLVYDEIEASIDYEPVPYLIWPDDQRPSGVAQNEEQWRYVGRQESFAVESVLVPGGSFEYEAGFLAAADVPEVPARVVPSFTAFLTWYEIPCVYDFTNAFGLPAIPTAISARIDGVLGRINSVDFLGYPPKTLLAVNAEPAYRRMADGNWCTDLKYTLAGRGRLDNSGLAAGVPSSSPDWERLLRRDGNFYRILNKVSGKGPYDDPVDFYDLFKTGA
jgi:hypothetical protein